MSQLRGNQSDWLEVRNCCTNHQITIKPRHIQLRKLVVLYLIEKLPIRTFRLHPCRDHRTASHLRQPQWRWQQKSYTKKNSSSWEIWEKAGREKTLSLLLFSLKQEINTAPLLGPFYLYIKERSKQLNEALLSSWDTIRTVWIRWKRKANMLLRRHTLCHPKL